MKLQAQIEGKSIILIDEISMVGPILFGHVSQRLSQITQKSLPFGGMAVCILGDFFQMPLPLPPLSLYSAVVQRFINHKQLGNPACPRVVGTELFTKFQMVELTQQMRAADDKQHTDVIEALRDINLEFPVSQEIINNLHILTADDVHNDPEWAFTPIIVTSNAERTAINFHLAKQFARSTGVPIITWYLPVFGPHVTGMSREDCSIMYAQENSLMGIFVAGADGYLTENVNPGKLLANGSPVNMHSLTFPPQTPLENIQLIRQQIFDAEPGQIILLHTMPYSLNVTLPTGSRQWPSTETLVEGQIVVPLLLSNHQKEVTVRAAGKTGPGKVKVKSHPIDLGFAITYHKVQGKTMSKIILDLNKRPFRPQITFTSFYVGVSRVRRGIDMRILPKQFGMNFKHLIKLQPDPNLSIWLAGFEDHTGLWNAQKSASLIPKKNKIKPVQAFSLLKTQDRDETNIIKEQNNHMPCLISFQHTLENVSHSSILVSQIHANDSTIPTISQLEAELHHSITRLTTLQQFL